MHPQDYATIIDGDFTLLTKPEAAQRLRISERHLDRLHEFGRGPPRVQLGERRIAYPLDGLIGWVKQHTSPAAPVVMGGRRTST